MFDSRERSECLPRGTVIALVMCNVVSWYACEATGIICCDNAEPKPTHRSPSFIRVRTIIRKSSWRMISSQSYSVVGPFFQQSRLPSVTVTLTEQYYSRGAVTTRRRREIALLRTHSCLHTPALITAQALAHGKLPESDDNALSACQGQIWLGPSTSASDTRRTVRNAEQPDRHLCTRQQAYRLIDCLLTTPQPRTRHPSLHRLEDQVCTPGLLCVVFCVIKTRAQRL